MVLSCNETPTGFKVHARVVNSSMAELQLVSFRPSCQPKDLRTQANSHNWDLGLHQTPGGLYRTGVDFGVSRSIADNYSSGTQFEYLVGRKVIWDANNPCALGEKAAQYSVFDAAVDDYDSRLLFSIIVDGFLGADFLYKILLVRVLESGDPVGYDLRVEW